MTRASGRPIFDAESGCQRGADGAEFAGVDDRIHGVDAAQGVAGHARGRENFVAAEQIVEGAHYRFVGQTFIGGLLLDFILPGLLGLLDRLCPCAICCVLWLASFDAVDDRAQGDLGIGRDRQCGGIIAAELIRIGVDLNDLGLLGNDFVTEAHGRAFAEGRAEGENQIRFLKKFAGVGAAAEAEAAERERMIFREHALGGVAHATGIEASRPTRALLPGPRPNRPRCRRAPPAFGLQQEIHRAFAGRLSMAGATGSAVLAKLNGSGSAHAANLRG